MPTSRKRIGFLPTEEVKILIDKICLKNNLSQSKVTGILVEEALNARNLYKLKERDFKAQNDLNNELDKPKISNKIDHITFKSNDIAEDMEYKLIKEYLNYKNFKKLLSIVESEC